MHINEYQMLARRTQNKDLTTFERKLHALHGLSSEVGEIHGVFQKHYQGHPVNYDEVKKELGDLMWFAAELCDTLFISLEDVCKANIEKLKARYPDGFSEERSINREEE